MESVGRGRFGRERARSRLARTGGDGLTLICSDKPRVGAVAPDVHMGMLPFGRTSVGSPGATLSGAAGGGPVRPEERSERSR